MMYEFAKSTGLGRWCLRRLEKSGVHESSSRVAAALRVPGWTHEMGLP